MSEARASHGETGAFSARTVIALLVAGVFAFSALVVLSAYAPDLRGGSDGGGHALSRSAIGFSGVTRLLKAIGDPVLVSRDPHARSASTGLLVLTPSPESDADALYDMTTSGPTLVVLPKWQAAPDMTTPGWATNVGVLDATAVAKLLAKRFGAMTIARDAGASPVRLAGLPGGDATTGPIDQFQTLSGGDGLIPLVRDARGRAVLAASADRRVFVLSDPDLMNTHGLKDLATARVAVTLIQGLRKADGPIVFDVTLNGFKRSRSLLKLAFQPPFLGATLCLAAAALLMALQALTRFGAPRPAGRAIALGKRALADNSAGLIRLARREPAMAGRYLDLTRAAVAKALGAHTPLGARMSEAELTALLDRQAERLGAKHRLAALTAEAGTVKDRAGLMRLSQDLYQWKMEMTGEHR
ncbi:MAG: hypothetical protein P4L73_17390 [Caulobacteraceae bacterium]|nr:hypothetical protein [Caulobacteraceae bacterium]